jgi:hypothetical protein
MLTSRQLPTARGLLALVALLGSLWTGGVAAPPDGGPAGSLAAAHERSAVEAALRDRAPALRPPLDRPGPWGAMLLLGAAAAAPTVAFAWRAAEVRHRQAGARSRVAAASLGARSPPRLQPA